MKTEHSTFNIQPRTPRSGTGGQQSVNGCWMLDVECWIFFLCLNLCPAAFGSTNGAIDADNSVSPPPAVQATARGSYNAGTKRLLAGKFDDAEMLLESSLARQDESVQPEALYNLGHVRFAQGIEELKKSPGGAATVNRGAASATAGEDAIQKASDALASDDVQQMVEAYLAGRGARREIRAATKAVQNAMEKYGKALAKWQRALNDFSSAAELNPADTNALHNAEIVKQAIARLVDRLQEMQQLATKLGGKKSELDKLLKQLKGKIPATDMPPGAPGGQDEDEDGDDGKLPSPESLMGKQEGDRGGGGQELGLKISAEQAGQLMNSLLPGAKQLPMGQGELGVPKNPSGRIW
jgi:tetratricopeptide (TPR) repeat protein